MNLIVTRDRSLSVSQPYLSTEILQAIEQGGSLANTNLQGIDFNQSDLSNADLSHTTLVGAN
ncbi:MAG: pentapeptide repeat-containing protein, partial [Microcystaceae cyanobacterium]